MKRSIIPLLAAIVISFIMATPALATTYNTSDEVYWYASAGDNNVMFTGTATDPSGFGPDIASVTIVNNNFDSNTSVTIEFRDASNSTISSTSITANGTQTVTAPSGTYYVEPYGTCTDTTLPNPPPWSYISQMTDTSGNVWVFGVPSAPSGSGGSGTCT